MSLVDLLPSTGYSDDEDEEDEEDSEEEGQPHDDADAEAEDEESDSDSDWSDCQEYPQGCRGIVNPNYPGFQHLAPSLLSSDSGSDLDSQDSDDAQDSANNNGAVNRLDVLGQQARRRRQLYDGSTFNIRPGDEKLVQVVQLATSVNESLQFAHVERMSDSSGLELSDAEEQPPPCTKHDEPDEHVESSRLGQMDLLAGLAMAPARRRDVPDVVAVDDEATVMPSNQSKRDARRASLASHSATAEPRLLSDAPRPVDDACEQMRVSWSCHPSEPSHLRLLWVIRFNPRKQLIG